MIKAIQRGCRVDMKTINMIHTVTGFLFLLIFLATGQYMASLFPGLYEGNGVIRVLYRANHIYLLLAALINLVLGIYLIQHVKNDRKYLQWFASILIVISPVLLLYGFFYESTSTELERPATFWGVVLMLSGVLLNVLAKIGERWGIVE